MAIMNNYRGNKIKIKGGVFVYSDTKESVELFKDKNCGKCKQPRTKEGHDGCLGTLKYVMNAYCGHGKTNEAYVQSLKIHFIGVFALIIINILKHK